MSARLTFADIGEFVNRTAGLTGENAREMLNTRFGSVEVDDVIQDALRENPVNFVINLLFLLRGPG